MATRNAEATISVEALPQVREALQRSAKLVEGLRHLVAEFTKDDERELVRLASYAGRICTDTESIRQRAEAARRWVEAGADRTQSGEPFLDLATRELFDHDIPALLAEVKRLHALVDEPKDGDDR